MQSQRVIALLFGLLAGACAKTPTPEQGPAKPPVELRAGVDKAVATTGDILKYEVVIERRKDIAVEVPEAGAEIAGFRIVDLGVDPPVEKDGRVTERRWYNLRADLVGSYILPPVSVSYVDPSASAPAATPTKPADDQGATAAPAPSDAAAPAPAKPDDKTVAPTDAPAPAKPEAQPPAQSDKPGKKTLSTSEIFVEVTSVLPSDGSAKDIRDIKPLEPRPKKQPWLWIGLGLAVLVLGSGVAVYLWWRKRREIALPPVPAHELAFAALEELRHTNFDDPEMLRRYYFKISEVVRQYVEGRFALNATDLTTEEIIVRLDELFELGPAPRAKLEGFLADTDQVKFAGRTPSADDAGLAYERALSFVEDTLPRPEPTEAPAGQGAP